MSPFNQTVTRGYGLLEKFLAKKRSKMADNLIPLNCRKGRILDIGCGSFPLFLVGVDFAEKYGLDKIGNNQKDILKKNGISFLEYDIECQSNLPYQNNFFDAITILAVFEHIEPKKTLAIVGEIYRILKPEGICVLTTPSTWAVLPLKIMAKMRLVSSTELAEHKYAYTPLEIKKIFGKIPFAKENLRSGYFECGMNIWITAKK
ncbi:MAG: methyltransferase [Parcubacteria group bacterium GW2011_GWC1_43_61]|nr:MAG: Methyltransferase family protein [Candidatus Azambacteria bacterium GW2011_GWF1_41_10]KKS49030.1 MAG: Methyltransferase family protein [Candidatus Azambacteria bacterium GW2011_GWF2_42_22]KKS69130.1 MAG: Methyltransferase family protein [Candidatus Azambacteria bacterium GW2011_GWA2_42_62]KKS73565.1 MAG: Methyltransferase family protein [Candidatus Azambacteria bacterium GW2011_GWB1_42_72]KKT03190.1 MAG: Methyltransferase family protein [Candidatus Azambacteria bacterium GW2011_GWD1_43_